MECSDCVMCLLLLCVMMAYARAQAAPGDHIDVTYNIVEELQPQSVIGNIAMDAKLDQKYGREALGSLEFSFLSPDAQIQHFFTIQTASGLLMSKSVIDRDVICAGMKTCDILLDVGVMRARSFEIIKVKVNVIDLNDNAPSFPESTLNLFISESASPGFTFVVPTASDPDSGKYGVQSYQANGATDKFELRVTNSSDGVDVHLVLRERIDREQNAAYFVQVVAMDGGLPPLSGTLDIDITVKDANDNSPKFTHDSYEAAVKENAGPGSVIARVSAVDLDEGPNGEVRYALAPQTVTTYGDVFKINETSGEIQLSGELDHESVPVYQLLVRAYDLGPDSMPSHTKVKVIVEDVNDHPPNIRLNAMTDTGNVEIPENSPLDTFVAHISVDDLDSGDNGKVTCNLNEAHFNLQTIYASVYQITTSSVFDRETQDSYIVTLSCQDKGNPPLSSTVDIKITVTDENDHDPIFSPTKYAASLKENSKIGMSLLRVNATDMDTGENARVTYSIQDSATLVAIDPDTGILRTNGIFDYEKMPRYDITVLATDQGKPARTAYASVSLTVIDLNDEAPVFTQASFTFATYENQPVPTELGVISATDADAAPFDRILYSLDPTHGATDVFAIHAESGRIVTKKFLDRETQPSYTLVAVATNPGIAAPSSTVTVVIHVADVNDNAPQIAFPDRNHKSVHIPRSAPRGYVFTRINATDADTGQNAHLTYTFAKGNEHGLFELDQATGVVSLKEDLDEEEETAFTLLVMVKDGGTEPKTAVAELDVIVNGSLTPFPSQKRTMIVGIPSAGTLTNQNTNIVIGLGVATVILVTILIVAIILVKRNQNKREREEYYSYEVHASPTKHPDGEERGVVDGGGSNGGILNISKDSDSRSSTSKKGVKFDMDHSCDKQNDLNSSMGSRTRQAPQGKELPAHQMAAAQCASSQYQIARVHPLPTSSSLVQNPKHTNNMPRHRLDPGDVMSRPWALTQRELEVHQMLQMLMQEPDSDSTSGCSAEGSNTDSGHGPSEDGDYGTKPTTFHADSRLSPILDDPNSDHSDGMPARAPLHKPGQGATPQKVKPKPPPRGQYGLQSNPSTLPPAQTHPMSQQHHTQTLPSQQSRTSSFKSGCVSPTNTNIQRPVAGSAVMYCGTGGAPTVMLPQSSYGSYSDKHPDNISDCTTTSGSINLDTEYQRHQALRGQYMDSVV